MTFEPCSDMQCSGCHRVDEIRHDNDGFLSATTYSGEYCVLTLPTVDLFTDPMTYVLFLVGKVPTWASVIIHVGDGSLDESLSEGDEGRQFVFLECFESEVAEEQHDMVVDSIALTAMENRMTGKELVDRFRDKYFGHDDGDLMDMFG